MAEKKDSSLIYGRHPVLDAIRAGRPLDKVMLQKGTRGEFEKEVRKLTKAHGITLQYAPKERLSKFTKGNHQGILAFVSLIPYYNIDDVLPFAYEKGEVPLIVILENVTDVRNFGSIARSAECAGAHAIVVPLKGAARINAEAMKTSAGALNALRVCRTNSLSNVIQYLKDSGVQVVATSLEGTQMVYEVDFTIPTAIVMGSEGDGISAHMTSISDQLCRIPQVGQTDSYNVSVASGILLYEVLRQRS